MIAPIARPRSPSRFSPTIDYLPAAPAASSLGDITLMVPANEDNTPEAEVNRAGVSCLFMPDYARS